MRALYSRQWPRAAAPKRHTPLGALRCFTTPSSYFERTPEAPPDAIMGIAALFAKDPRPEKVNLCIGVYRDAANQPLILDSVRRSMAYIAAHDTQMDYAPIAGLPSFVQSMQRLCFGDAALDDLHPRLASVQSLSGTGALTLGLSLLRIAAGPAAPPLTVHIPSPSYPNHLNIIRHLEMEVSYYPYYNLQRHELDIAGLLAYMNQLPPQSVVILHACSHNPTGCDPSPEQWQAIVEVMQCRGIIPFIDMAYQGFATGDVDRDAAVLRQFHTAGLPNYLVAQSLAKNFGLYGQRTGALHVCCTSAAERARVMTQLQSLIRSTYSNPPIFGARIADHILRSPELTALWKNELLSMSCRMQSMRTRLVQELSLSGSSRDWFFLERGIGMMSLLGLSEEQVSELQQRHAVYMTANSRLAFAGLNERNIKYVANAIHEVSRHSG